MNKPLDSFIKQKRFFNENDKKDTETYRQFLVNNGWGANCCPFILQEPYTSIPNMINDRLIKKFLMIPSPALTKNLSRNSK